MKLKSYRELIAWQKAMALVTDVYRHTQDFPGKEMYGLTSQIRRSAVSVPSNIAEGQGRRSTGEFQQFLGHAKGSLFELETQILIARNLNYLSEKGSSEPLASAGEVGRILNGLVDSLAA
ncbi:MAG TPA: four helix bundle protein [Terriglobales bacterium]|nr:four helix bundle protein [Terriglobales bacterium]